MNVRLLQIAGLSLAGLLVLTGCPSDEDDDGPIGMDATPRDTGEPDGQDAGPGDMGPGGMDARVDAGRPDATPPPTGGEGEPCNPDETCDDPALSCADFTSGLGTAPGPNMRPVVMRCLRDCTTDTDCDAASGNTLCRPVFFDQTACVSAERGEGLMIDVRGPSATNPLTGCAVDLLAFPPDIGSLMFAVENGELSCGRACNPAAAPGSPAACTNAFPYCNPQLLNPAATSSTGVCGLRRTGPGDPCSQGSVVGLCDTANTPAGNRPDAICVGMPAATMGGPRPVHDPADPANSPQAPHTGVCLLFSSTNDTDCSAMEDPGTAGMVTCSAFPGSTDCVCSNNCNDAPDSCQGRGAFNLGSACIPGLAFDQTMEPFALCRAVNPPAIDEFNFTDAPNAQCAMELGGAFRCPANTQCFGSTQPPGGVCVRVCDDRITPTGCELSQVGTSSCADDEITLEGIGLCIPPPPP